MGVQVCLRTDLFEVNLEGITFKPKDLEHPCHMDFVFSNGKIWDRPPVVGIDVMPHPRNPSIRLLLLCFGVGCVILRFAAGEPLPASIRKFVSDKRIKFVGLGILEKQDLFPFKELGVVDVGCLAAEALNQPKCRKWELPDLAWRALGIKKMVVVTEASSPERHAQMKSAICRLFITSIIAMGLLHPSPKNTPFLRRKKNQEVEEGSVCVQIGENDYMYSDATKLPLKGILKCPSTKCTGLKRCKSVRWEEEKSPAAALKRANSRGHNAGFSC